MARYLRTWTGGPSSRAARRGQHASDPQHTLRIYILGAVWLLVTIGVLAVVVGPMGSVYALVGLSDPLLRTLGTMVFAITAASLVAGLLRRPSGRVRRSDRQPAAYPAASSHAGTTILDATL